MCKVGNCKQFAKGSDFWQIEQYGTELTQSRNINHCKSLEVNYLELYSTEGNIIL